MTSRKVLTVNQVFEILVQWVEKRDWNDALYAVMPKRKFNCNAGVEGGGTHVFTEEEDQEGNVPKTRDSTTPVEASVRIEE